MPAQFDPQILARADRNHLLGAMARIARRRPDEWLISGHPAKDGQLPRTWKKVSGIDAARLVEAVAVAAPAHCADGWAYVSRATAAILAGDAHSARHLAYYAQLRAALCLLANLGVGVFNGVNFVIEASGVVTRLDPHVGKGRQDVGLGTHNIAWLALQTWAAEPSTAEVFLDLVKIRGSSLREAIESIWPGFAKVTASGTIIESWGIDLRRAQDEHIARNISSYAPQALNPVAISTNASLRFVATTWRLFEPSFGSSFDNLDRHLLRTVFWKQHQVVDPGIDYGQGEIPKRYGELPVPIQQVASLQFLIGQKERIRPELLRQAEAKTKPARPIAMLARAFLLLRTATALTRSSLEESGLRMSAGVLRPWLDGLAVDRGFWAKGAAVENVADLWSDVEAALTDLERSRKPAPPGLRQWLKASRTGMPTISEAERIAVWSLGA